MGVDKFQLTFDFDGVSEEAVIGDSKKTDSPFKIEEQTNISEEENPLVEKPLSPKDIRRAVLGWMLKKKPSGMGLLVPTRISRFLADVAAFWSSPISINGKKYLAPVKSAIVEIRNDREQCWPDFGTKDELLELLKIKREEKKRLQAHIRLTESDLKMNDNLFPEYENWNYRGTKDKDYHLCLRKINDVELALYNGSKFEKIRRAELADYLYLAVPEGEVEPHELADGWGLLYVKKDLSVTEIKAPSFWNCSLEKKYHLVQNISSSSLKDTLFSNGVKVSKDESISFTRLPRRRRK
jgi:hypothetical protein